jgi:acyl phosphate:glycerol-3-phosphate acyltransferase
MSSGDWSDILFHLLFFAGGYLLGSIPFGLILARAAGLGDVRRIGSGNIGATNVLRAGDKKIAALTLILDIAKGTAAVLIAARWGEGAALSAALGAFLGHLFPVWLNFRGGKGVATYLGILLGLSWPAAVSFAAVWLLVAFVTRYSSLAALTASAASVVTLVVMAKWHVAALSLLLSALLFVRHSANIGRLVRGEEARIGRTK